MTFHRRMHRVIGIDLDSTTCECAVLMASEVEGSSTDSDPIVVWYPVEKAYVFPCERCKELFFYNPEIRLSYKASNCTCQWRMYMDKNGYYEGRPLNTCVMHSRSKQKAMDRWKRNPEIVIEMNAAGKVKEWDINEHGKPISKELDPEAW